MTTEAATVEPTTGGLLDNVQATDNSTTENPQATEIDHKASPAASEDDVLERPDFWPENFWKKDENMPDLEGIAKSWKDLRKKISQNAPADGKYNLKAFGDQGENHPMAESLTKFAADHGLSQAAFDDLVGNLKSADVVEAVDSDEELKKLGPNATAIVNGMVDWARGLVNKGVWAPEDFEEFKVMGGTAQGLRALMKIREAYEGRIPVESIPVEGAVSKDDLYAMVADPKYQTDPAYRKKVEKMFNQIVK